MLGNVGKVSSRFTAAGLYTITLALTDPSGATGTDQVVITVR